MLRPPWAHADSVAQQLPAWHQVLAAHVDPNSLLIRSPCCSWRHRFGPSTPTAAVKDAARLCVHAELVARQNNVEQPLYTLDENVLLLL
jgi:hypothetical protein